MMMQQGAGLIGESCIEKGKQINNVKRHKLLKHKITMGISMWKCFLYPLLLITDTCFPFLFVEATLLLSMSCCS